MAERTSAEQVTAEEIDEELHRQHRRRNIIIVIIIAVVVIAAAIVVFNLLTPRVAATVNGQKIYEKDVTNYVDSFRQYAGYEDDEDWANYLADAEMTPEDMRNAGIQTLAQRIVFEQKAEELGVSVTDEDMEEAMATAKANTGYGELTDEQWQAYLNLTGFTEEQYTDQVYLTTLEDKICAVEVPQDDDSSSDTEGIFDYIEENASSIGGKESAYISSDNYELCFQLLQYLQTLKPDEVRDNMSIITQMWESGALDEEYSEQMETIKEFMGEATLTFETGWDCYEGWEDWYQATIDELDPGELCNEVKADESGSNYYVIFCVDSYDPPEDGYTSLEQAKKKMPGTLYDATVTAAENTDWSEACGTYLSSLMDEADLKINPMPSGLPYDVS